MANANNPNPDRPPDRIIPPTYGELELTFTGQAPLLMNAPTMLDPFSPITREIQSLTAKKSSSRTADEHMSIAKLSWRASLYHDDDLGPYMPGAAVKASLAGAGTRWRLGSVVRRSLIVVAHKVALVYDGPRDVEDLWEEGYRDVRAVRNAGASGSQVPRVRPCFEQWTLVSRTAYDPQELDTDRIWRIGERAGILGIGDFRPEFGTFRFDLKVLKQPRDDEEKRAA
jgi:hypothetical protein